jgi:hypothetical protein
MSQAGVRNVIEANWNAAQPGGPAPSRHKMTFEQACLGQSGGGRGRQIAFFRSETPADSGVGYAPDTQRLNDYQGSTSSHCFSQYHMRFWSDAAIAANIPGYGRTEQMAISGVHHDTSTGDTCLANHCAYAFGTGHRVSGLWNAYRNYAVHRGMRFLCGRSHWKRRPGADHNFQGHRFDGWIGIIKFTYDGANDANCSNGLK